MQQLIMETLASRYRLGHNIWTFTMNNALPKALKGLESSGYVEVLSPTIQHTTRASLTEQGRWLILDKDYVPPIVACDKPCDREDCPVNRYNERMARR